MKNKEVISATIGGTFFAIPYLMLSIPILPSLAIASAAFVAGELVLKDNKTLKEKNLSLYKILEEAKKQKQHIQEMVKNIDDETLREKIKEISETTNKIIKTIENSPDKYKISKKFFDYYLPMTVKVIDRYDLIENQKLNSSNSKEFMKTTDKMIDEAKEAFNKILNNLYENDMIDTDIEMKVFNSMLKSDGFTKDELKISKEDNNG